MVQISIFKDQPSATANPATAPSRPFTSRTSVTIPVRNLVESLPFILRDASTFEFNLSLEGYHPFTSRPKTWDLYNIGRQLESSRLDISGLLPTICGSIVKATFFHFFFDNSNLVTTQTSNFSVTSRTLNPRGDPQN